MKNPSSSIEDQYYFKIKCFVQWNPLSNRYSIISYQRIVTDRVFDAITLFVVQEKSPLKNIDNRAHPERKLTKLPNETI